MKQLLKCALVLSLLNTSFIYASQFPLPDGFFSDEDLFFEIDETDTSDNPISLINDTNDTRERNCIVNTLKDLKGNIVETWETTVFMGSMVKSIIKSTWKEKNQDRYGDIDTSLLEKCSVLPSTSVELVKIFGNVAIMIFPDIKDSVNCHLQDNVLKYVLGVAVITSFVVYKKCDRGTLLKVLAIEATSGVIIAALHRYAMIKEFFVKEEIIDTSCCEWMVIEDGELVNSGTFEEEKDLDGK